jgi:hypothetical protein
MTTDSPACIHRIHDGKIHEYIFTEVSRRALDEMFAIIEEIVSDAARNNRPEDQYNPTLLDSSIGIQPLNHAFQKMQPLAHRYPAIQRARIAIIVPPTPLLGTISKIIRTVTPMRFYKPGERNQALAWLREAQVMSQG